jgi:hypothetical protein
LKGRLPAEAGTPQRCGIVTLAGLRRDQVPWDTINVIVRADGGVGRLALPQAVVVRPAFRQDDGPLLVVDLDDRHYPQLRRHARQRHRAYLEEGWVPAGEDATRRRIVEFIKRRLKGGGR